MFKIAFFSPATPAEGIADAGEAGESSHEDPW